MRDDSTAYIEAVHWVLDEVQHELSGAEFRVLLFIIRWTLGAGQDSAAIGDEQFRDGTGLKDRATLANALARLELRGLIAREPHQGRAGGGSSTARYRVLFDHERENPTVVTENPTVVAPVPLPATPVPTPATEGVMATPTPRPAPTEDALSRRVWDALGASRVLHRHQVDALRSIVVREWDAEHLVLAPASAAEERLAWAHKRDIERFLAQAGQFRCVVDVLPPESTLEPDLDEPPDLDEAPHSAK